MTKKTKRPRGRPPVANPASARLGVRVTPKSLAAYTKAAEARDMTLSAWIVAQLDKAAS